MTVLRRDDPKEWPQLMLYELGGLLDEVRARFGDEASFVPNGVGNLAIVTPHGIGRWYVGYIDFATGAIVWTRDEEHSPFAGDLMVVRGGTHEANRP